VVLGVSEKEACLRRLPSITYLLFFKPVGKKDKKRGGGEGV